MKRERRAWLFAVIACGILLVARVARDTSHNGTPAKDQGHDLELSLALRRAGGLLGWLRDCATGTYREANRHPLFPLLISPLAGPDPGFFDRAVAAALGFSALGLAGLFAAARRSAGQPAGAAMLCWIAVVPSAAHLAGRIGPEALLAAVLGSGWLLLWEPEPWAAWAAGALFGLGYLLKATAVLVLAGGLAGAAAGGMKPRRLAQAAAAFALAASPLLWRNLLVYGQPFYNENQHWIWLDRWPEFWVLWRAGLLDKLGPTVYLRSHTLGQALFRWVYGLWLCVETIWGSWSPVGPFGSALLLGLAGFGWWNDRDAVRRLSALGIALAFWAAFAWFVVVNTVEHYFIPVLPVAAFYAGRATLELRKRLKGRARIGVPALAGAAALALAVPAWLDRLPSADSLRSPELQRMLGWMDANLEAGEAVVSNADDFFSWMLSKPIQLACLTGYPLGEVGRYARWGRFKHVALFNLREPIELPGFDKKLDEGRIAVYEATPSEAPSEGS